MTREDAIRAMLDGKKVRATGEVNEEFFLFFDGTGFIDNEDDFYKFNENSADEWEIYEEPKRKVKMWQWVYQTEHGGVGLTMGFHVSAGKALSAIPVDAIVLQRADWTEIEVDL